MLRRTPIYCHDCLQEVAEAIANGEVVGWFQGKGEFGPRALGSRSLLADPRDPKMPSRINTDVKKRWVHDRETERQTQRQRQRFHCPLSLLAWLGFGCRVPDFVCQTAFIRTPKPASADPSCTLGHAAGRTSDHSLLACSPRRQSSGSRVCRSTGRRTCRSQHQLQRAWRRRCPLCATWMDHRVCRLFERRTTGCIISERNCRCMCALFKITLSSASCRCSVCASSLLRARVEVLLTLSGGLTARDLSRQCSGSSI